MRNKVIAIIMTLALSASLCGCMTTRIFRNILEDTETSASQQNNNSNNSNDETTAGGTSSTSSTSSASGDVTDEDETTAPSGNITPGDASATHTITDYSDAESVTVMVYMNGSNLESESGEATTDISEMLKGKSGNNCKVVIETIGTKQWQNYGISSDHAQRYLLQNGSPVLVDNSLSQLDVTTAAPLADFIAWSATNYPADRYILILWDHGGGPVYGFGYDDITESEDALSIDEIVQALAANSNLHFDFIGMDCCIMASLEIVYALAPYCDYSILSEDFESGYGWEYSTWLGTLENDPGINTVSLSKQIIDDMINYNVSINEIGILTCFNETKIAALTQAWMDFAYANETALLENNYSSYIEGGENSRATGMPALASKRVSSKGDWDFWGDYDGGYYSEDEYEFGTDISEYYITDIMAVASNIDSDESSALSAALSASMVYCNYTQSDASYSGLSVTLPYGSSDFYSYMETVFKNIGLDSTYVAWLQKFVSASGSSDYYDYSDYYDDWGGWDDYYNDEDGYYYYDYNGDTFDDYSYFFDDDYDQGYENYDYDWYDEDWENWFDEWFGDWYGEDYYSDYSDPEPDDDWGDWGDYWDDDYWDDDYRDEPGGDW